MHLTLFDQGGLFALGQVLMIDIVLAGDNAVVIGLAAARVPAASAAQGHPVGPGAPRWCCGSAWPWSRSS